MVIVGAERDRGGRMDRRERPGPERREFAPCPDDVGIGAAAALFAALADVKTADFIRAVFPLPEHGPLVTTEKCRLRVGRKRLWHVAIIESPRPGRGPEFLNVAHVVIDAGDGRVRERCFLRNVRDDEYREFVRARFLRPAGCRGQSP